MVVVCEATSVEPLVVTQPTLSMYTRVAFEEAHESVTGVPLDEYVEGSGESETVQVGIMGSLVLISEMMLLPSFATYRSPEESIAIPEGKLKPPVIVETLPCGVTTEILLLL